MLYDHISYININNIGNQPRLSIYVQSYGLQATYSLTIGYGNMTQPKTYSPRPRIQLLHIGFIQTLSKVESQIFTVQISSDLNMY